MDVWRPRSRAASLGRKSRDGDERSLLCAAVASVSACRRIAARQINAEGRPAETRVTEPARPVVRLDPPWRRTLLASTGRRGCWRSARGRDHVRARRYRRTPRRGGRRTPQVEALVEHARARTPRRGHSRNFCRNFCLPDLILGDLSSSGTAHQSRISVPDLADARLIPEVAGQILPPLLRKAPETGPPCLFQ